MTFPIVYITSLSALIFCLLVSVYTLLKFCFGLEIQRVGNDGDQETHRKLSIRIRLPGSYRLLIYVFGATHQHKLRTASLAIFVICSACKLSSFVLETHLRVPLFWYSANSSYYLLSLFYNISFWSAYGCYILASMERFRRLEMILVRSATYYLFQFMRLWVISLVLCIVVYHSICDLLWILYRDTNTACEPIAQVYYVILLLTIVLFISIELTVNIRLVLGCLLVHKSPAILKLAMKSKDPQVPLPFKQQPDDERDSHDISYIPLVIDTNVDSLQISNSQTNRPRDPSVCLAISQRDRDWNIDQQQRRLYRKYRHLSTLKKQMLIFASLLLLLDLCIASLYIASIVYKPQSTFQADTQVPTSLALECWGLLLSSLHLFSGFTLLDIFLVKLRESKQLMFETTFRREVQPIPTTTDLSVPFSGILSTDTDELQTPSKLAMNMEELQNETRSIFTFYRSN